MLKGVAHCNGRKSPLQLQAIKRGIRKVAKEEKSIRLAYLFGSHARGCANGESDIDVALLLDPALSKDERYELRLRLYSAFAADLHIDDEFVDLSVLNDASILLQMNAIECGPPVFMRDPNECLLYELRVRQRYDDERFHLEQENDVILDRILQRSL